MNINSIREICKKHGEAVFRMSLSHMVAVGADRLRNINVEEAVKEILATDNPKALITPQMQASILRCTCELAQQDLWDILAFVQTDIGIQGISVHPGVYVDFCDKQTGGKLCTCVLPAGTDEDLIEEVAEEIRKNKLPNSFGAQLSSLIRAEFRKKGIRVEPVGQDLGIEL